MDDANEIRKVCFTSSEAKVEVGEGTIGVVDFFATVINRIFFQVFYIYIDYIFMNRLLNRLREPIHILINVLQY